jgi:hypothetical protein
MPWPADLTTKTVTSSYPNNGTGLNGWCSFVPTADLADSTGLAILRAAPMQEQVTNGVMAPIVLPCTDNADLSPSGWAWTVVENLQGAPPRVWSFFLPHTLPSTVDLSALTPLVTPPSLVQYLLAANNLSDLTNPAAARTSLGLGSAATQASTAFDVAGAAATALATAESFATSAVATETTRAQTAEAGKAQGLTVTAVQTASYAMALGDFARFDVSGGSVSQPLPSGATSGARVGAKLIKNSATNSNTVTLTCQGSDVFNVAGGSTSLALTLPAQGVVLQYLAGSPGVWTVQSDDIPLTPLRNLFPDWLNGKGYGAVGNGVRLTDGAMTAASNVFTSASASFTAADVGKLIVVMGAGALNGAVGVPLPGTIAGFTSATQVTLSASAVTTVAGATATYGTDDLAKNQAMINACAPGQTAFLPYGIYMHSGELSVTTPIRLTGDGATIVTTNSAAINFQNTYITAASGSSTTIGLEIDHLVFDVSGGHVLYNCNWNKFSLHDLRLVQRSYQYAVWYSTAQNLLDTDVRNVVTRVYGNPRTVPAWYFKSALGGGIAMWKSQNTLFQNGDLDATQYYVWIECEDASNHSYTNDLTFEHAWFDSAYGGCVKLLATQSASFRSCNVIDSYSATWGNSAYYIGAATSNGLWASQKVSFHDCGRDLSGPNGTTSWDIECEATTDSVTISNYAIRDTVQPPTNTKPQFNFHGCTNVLLLNNKFRIITNPATTSVELLDGNITYTGLLSGANQPNIDLPQHHGWRSWPFDLKLCNSTANLTAGVLQMVMQYINDTGPLTGVMFNLTTAPTTPTAGENFIALIDQSTGSVVAVSADMTAAISTSGVKKVPFTAQFTPVAGRLYWAVVLPNFSAGTFTLARLSNANGPLNSGQGATNYEFATNGTAQIAVPGSITPSANGAGGGAWWVGTY